MLTQHIGIDLVAGDRQHIRDQHGVPRRPIDTECGDEIDLVQRSDDRIDLTELDTETAHLHLEVTTTDVLERTGAVPAHHITGAIHPLTSTERRRNETLRRQTQPIVIPTSQTGTRQIQLTRNTHRNRTQTGVQHELRGPGDRRTDGDRLTDGHSLTDRREHSCLGRTVSIEHRPAGSPPLHQLRTAGVAASHDDLQLIETRRVHRGQRSRSDERMCHRLLPQQVRQFCATVHIGRRNHQPRPAAERQHHLEHRGIEARRRKREHTCIGCHTEPVSLLLREVRKPAVGDHNTLRHTRRTGRVNQVRRIIERRNRQHNRIQISCSRSRLAVQQQPLHTRTSLGKHRDVLRDGHTHHNTGIGKHMRHTIDRIRRIHRQERSTGLRHRPHRNNRLHRTTQPQRHERTHTHTTRGQQPSQLRRTSIQLAIRNRHITRHQRHSIDTSNSNRRSKHLRQQPTRHRHTTTHRHQHRTLGLRQQLELADPEIRLRRKSFEDAHDARENGLDLAGLEQFRQVLGLDVQTFVDHRHQGQRVLRSIAAVDDVGHAQPGDIRLVREAGAIDRVGLEHGQRIECDGRSHRALNLGQPEVVVVQQMSLLGLKPLDELAQRFVRVHGDTHRQGVDEQTDHLLDVVDLGWSARHGRPEQDIGASGQCGEDGPPCGLNERVHGDTALAGDRTESRSVRWLQRGPVDSADGGFLAAAFDRREQSRFRQPGQRLNPCCPRSGGVAPGHPREVVTVGRHPRQHGIVAVRCIQREQFPDDERSRPTVDQDVVVGQDETPPCLADGNEGESQQRCLRHVESGGSVYGHQGVEFDLRIGLSQLCQVMLEPRDSYRSLHYLNRVAFEVVHESGPQVRMAVEKGLRGTMQSGGVDRTCQFHDQLHDVRVHGLIGQFRVEEHPRLQRRHRPDVTQSRVATFDVVDGVLVEGNQFEIGRGESACSRGIRVLCQARQSRDPERGQLFDVGAIEYARRERERRLEHGAVAATGGHRVDVEYRRHR